MPPSAPSVRGGGGVHRYEAAEGGQPGLGFHRDDSELSFQLLLSSPEDFEGGGTSFELDAAGEDVCTLRPQQGEMTSHFGRLRHAGNPVTSGTRYVLAGFVRCRPLAAAWRSLRRANEPDATDEQIADPST